MDIRTRSLFDQNTTRPGSLGCIAEIAATLADAIKRAAERGISREEIVARMSTYLGEKINVGTLNGYTAPSHTTQAAERGVPERHISFQRAMAFDAAVKEDVLLGLFASLIGDRIIINQDDDALLQWARLHRQEKELAERKRELEAVMKARARK